MAKKELTIKLTIEYDEEKNDGKPARIFLYQFITRLNREYRILDVEYKNIKQSFRNKINDINKIALRKVDSISNEDLPKKPIWLKDRTVVPKEK